MKPPFTLRDLEAGRVPELERGLRIALTPEHFVTLDYPSVEHAARLRTAMQNADAADYGLLKAMTDCVDATGSPCDWPEPKQVPLPLLGAVTALFLRFQHTTSAMLQRFSAALSPSSTTPVGSAKPTGATPGSDARAAGAKSSAPSVTTTPAASGTTSGSAATPSSRAPTPPANATSGVPAG